MVLPLLAFAGTLALMLGGYWLVVVHARERKRRKLRTRLQHLAATGAPGVGVDDALIESSDLLKDVEERPAVRQGGLPLAERLSRYLQTLIQRAGVTVRVQNVLYASLILFAVACGVALLLTRHFAISVSAGSAALTLPVFYLQHLANRRIRRFEEHFPEAIDIIARALRAGHAFTTGIVMVAEEVPEPVSTEFRLLYEHQNYGLPLSDALREFADRVPLLDARLFVTAVMVQREVGGNLSEVLDNLGAVMRARFYVRRQVRALTAHGRLTGWILGLLPVALGLLLCVLNPEHPRLLLEDPIGVRMVIVAMVLQVTGMLIVRKVVAVEY